MSTHDYVIANQNGANTRSDLNNAFSAIVSNNSSASEPSTTYAYMWWADTANDLLKQRNAADSAWINILTLSTGAIQGGLINDNGTNVIIGTGQANPRIRLGGSTTTGLEFSDGNTAFVLSGANTLDTYTSGILRTRLDNVGNVLIAKTSDGGNTVGHTLANAGYARHVRDGGAALVVNRKTSDGDIVVFEKDNTTVGNINITGGSIIFGRGDTALAYNDVLDAVYPIQADGNTRDNAIDLGRSSARFKNAYLSGSVYLGGTAAANALDDYEEGTHAVTVTPQTSGSITLSSDNDLSYTKIGNIVHVHGRITVSSVSSPTGEIHFSLPFTINSGPGRSGDTVGAAQLYSTDFANDSVMVTAYVTEGTSHFRFMGTKDNAGWDSQTVTHAANDIYVVSLTYRTT